MESLNAYVGGEVMEGGRYILNNERYYKGTLLTANQR